MSLRISFIPILLVLVDRSTRAARAYKLRKKFHRQIEGLAILDDGAIVLVEDNAEGVSRLTKYESLDQLRRLNEG